MTIRSFCTLFFVTLILTLTSCDLRSGTAKDEMEKWESAPSPSVSALPTSTPVDPADIMEVDPSVNGDVLSANGHAQKTATACTKFNRLLVNGDDGVISVKGGCRQIMINGDRNKITADAVMEFVFNGSDNIVKYARLLNGKAPSVIQNRADNVVEKVALQAMTTASPPRKITK